MFVSLTHFVAHLIIGGVVYLSEFFDVVSSSLLFLDSAFPVPIPVLLALIGLLYQIWSWLG